MTPERERRVAVVDVASFTLPYDHSLCAALTTHDWCPTLFRGPAEPGPWDSAPYVIAVRDSPRSRSMLPAPVRMAARGLSHFAEMRRLRRALARLSPHVVHFQWLPLPLVDAGTIRVLRDTAPLVLTLHNTTVFHGGRSLQATGLSRAVRQFEAVIVHTDYSRRQLIERRWTDPSRIHVIPHGVLDYYRNIAEHPARLQKRKDRVTLLFFGNLKEYKGLDVLFRALAVLEPAVRAQAHLIVAGPGTNGRSLRELARRLGVADIVEWHNEFIPETQVAGFFEVADVVALPYREIDQSGVLLTAIGLEKPVIASRLGGIPETIPDGRAAILVPPEDERALAAAIARFVMSPALQRRLAEGIREVASGPLSWSSIGAQTAQLYGQLVR